MFNFDDRAARAFGILTVMLQKAGTMIGVPDLMIAATALSRGAIVVTSNPRDFGRVPGLITENWRAR
jgi:tRNA(fMet)-specific endonuclease VapC